MIATALPDALRQTWPPFVLVAGLLLIGAVASSDGLFEALGSRIARLPGTRLTLFVSLMALVALVTVVLNLDTSVVFVTPILLHVARRRGVRDTAFLYGAIFMSNAASLLLPGSNLTNLLVLGSRHLSGASFAARTWPSWTASVIVTVVILVVWRWRDFSGDEAPFADVTRVRPGGGLLGVAAAAVIVLIVPDPSLPVAGVGIAVALAQLARRRTTWRDLRHVISPVTLVGLFALAVALGTLARTWSGPARLMSAAGPWASAALGAVAANLFNNLPAAVLLSSRIPRHPLALLIGLDLGPNLTIIGALSAVLWLRVARQEGATPSVATYSRVGVIVVLATITLAMVALRLLAPAGW
ncbi:MAG: SLC13 family permease [Acidimicrobiales bacterium]